MPDAGDGCGGCACTECGSAVGATQGELVVAGGGLGCRRWRFEIGNSVGRICADVAAKTKRSCSLWNNDLLHDESAEKQMVVEGRTCLFSWR